MSQGKSRESRSRRTASASIAPVPFEGWKELLDLCRGNSRLICGFALGFSGAPCAAFGLDPPGVQFHGRGGCGKTAAARTVTSMWGWDLTPGARLGFGSSWNAKPNALEVIAAGCNEYRLVFRRDGVIVDSSRKSTLSRIEELGARIS